MAKEMLSDLIRKQETILNAFFFMLGREVFVLIQRPHQLWQQFYNRPQ